MGSILLTHHPIQVQIEQSHNLVTFNLFYGYHGIQNNLRSSLGIFIDDAQNVKEWVTIHAQ